MSADNNLTTPQKRTYELDLDKREKKSAFFHSVRNLLVILFLVFTGVGFTALSSKKNAKINLKINELFRIPAPRGLCIENIYYLLAHVTCVYIV